MPYTHRHRSDAVQRNRQPIRLACTSVILQNYAEGQVRSLQYTRNYARRRGIYLGLGHASVLQSFADEEDLVMPAQRAEPGLG
jgi:hypothetical protein